MVATPQRPKGRNGTISVSNVAIEVMNLVKEVMSIAPPKAIFGSGSSLLTMIKVCLLLHDGVFRAHVQQGLNGQ